IKLFIVKSFIPGCKITILLLKPKFLPFIAIFIVILLRDTLTPCTRPGSRAVGPKTIMLRRASKILSTTLVITYIGLIINRPTCCKIISSKLQSHNIFYWNQTCYDRLHFLLLYYRSRGTLTPRTGLGGRGL